jgi:3-hydroxyisobutyrate dehydrogenase-like beta-hydroxyacid dehydrogenase
MSTIKPTHSGIIGLGIVGSRIASTLDNQDIQVHTWNRSPKDAPNFAASAAEVAELTDFIQLFVRNGDDVLEVINAMADTLTDRHVVISHATIAPNEARQANQAVAATGAAFLEAPFTGSKNAAQSGDLVYYISGDPEVLEKARPLLELSSRDILYVGEKIGTAAVLKITTNMVSASTVAILAEALSLTEAQNIDPDLLAKALKNNACHSPLVDMKLPSMAEGDFDPHFSLRNMLKDAQFGLSMGTNAGLDLPVLSTVTGTMFTAIRHGHEDKDFSALLTNYQSPATPVPPVSASQNDTEEQPLHSPEPLPDSPPQAEQSEDPLQNLPAPPSTYKAAPIPTIPRGLPPKRPASSPPQSLAHPPEPPESPLTSLDPTLDDELPPPSDSDTKPIDLKLPPSSPEPEPEPAPNPEPEPQPEPELEPEPAPEPEPEPQPAPEPEPEPAAIPKRKSRFSFRSKPKSDPAPEPAPAPEAPSEPEPGIASDPAPEPEVEDPY